MPRKGARKVKDDDSDDDNDAPKYRRAKTMTKSKRSNLLFPVGRVQRMLKTVNQRQLRVSAGSGVYMAAVLEYLCSEVLELASTKVDNDRRKRIKPRDLMEAIRQDDELDEMLQGVEFADAGTLTSLQPILTKKRADWTRNDKLQI